ncbi:MAG: 50S ribosomal protein L9 [Bacteroidota bacterium]|jgi:large subunit ribosomal protein L9|nr:50S ribosomal protein L9 [Bacteroidota bacterium]|tara:strand:- start:2065 stop:2517 length:453 start_codon:yes stop_codon:yes gene_type:complete
MEIILKEDVENLGLKDEIVIVKNGYGRNFLIPRGYAILATSSAKKVLAENLRQREQKDKKLIADAEKISKKLSKIEIKIDAKVGEGDKLFGSVTNIDIEKYLNSNGFEIDKKYIKIIGGSVKSLGKYKAIVRLHRELSSEIEFEVLKSKA